MIGLASPLAVVCSQSPNMPRIERLACDHQSCRPLKECIAWLEAVSSVWALHLTVTRAWGTYRLLNTGAGGEQRTLPHSGVQASSVLYGAIKKHSRYFLIFFGSNRQAGTHKIGSQKSSILNPQSSILNPQSLILNPQSLILNT